MCKNFILVLWMSGIATIASVSAQHGGHHAGGPQHQGNRGKASQHQGHGGPGQITHPHHGAHIRQAPQTVVVVAPQQAPMVVPVQSQPIIVLNVPIIF